MQLACPPRGVSLPEAEQACTSLQARGTKMGTLVRPEFLCVLFLSFLNPISGVIVSRDDPNRR